MTTGTIRTTAQRGFAVYHQDRVGRSWDAAGNAVTLRWELVAARVLNSEITTGQALRTAYLDGYECKDWTALSTHGRRRWADVLAAMQAAGEARRAA